MGGNRFITVVLNLQVHMLDLKSSLTVLTVHNWSMAQDVFYVYKI